MAQEMQFDAQVVVSEEDGLKNQTFQRLEPMVLREIFYSMGLMQRPENYTTSFDITDGLEAAKLPSNPFWKALQSQKAGVFARHNLDREKCVFSDAAEEILKKM